MGFKRVDMSRLVRNRQNTAANQHGAIQGRIHASHNISKDDVVQLFHVNKPACQGCRVNSKDNPNCFCCFVPPANGVRKQGLWQKMPDTIVELGPDPGKSWRLSQDAPAGLTNLGATCYVNSVLQCLYMISRDGIGEISSSALPARLAVAQLHSGKKTAVDSAPFSSTLELDNGVQQDGQEFMKLLLLLLERVLGMSQNAWARNIVQHVFRGTYSYVIICSKCGKESASSKKAVDFYELELNVQGFTSLEESLHEYLSDEVLQGENQWKCERCQMRVDDMHCTKLHSLPPVLNFQLKRFVFNMKTATKKVTSKFSFPRTINMGYYCLAANGENESRSDYDLSAILVHKMCKHSSVSKVSDQIASWDTVSETGTKAVLLHPSKPLISIADEKETVSIEADFFFNWARLMSTSICNLSDAAPSPTSAPNHVCVLLLRDENGGLLSFQLASLDLI